METPPLDLQGKFVRNPDFMTVPMDGDLVMLSLSQGRYFGINRVGVRIWEALEQPMSVNLLAELLVDEFDVDATRCLLELQQFVQQLLQSNIIIPTGSAQNTPSRT